MPGQNQGHIAEAAHLQLQEAGTYLRAIKSNPPTIAPWSMQSRESSERNQPPVPVALIFALNTMPFEPVAQHLQIADFLPNSFPAKMQLAGAEKLPGSSS